jgi:hypothetical protein
MNPEGLERPRNLREFRARLNLEPDRFTIGKTLYPYCQGDEISRNERVFIDRFLGYENEIQQAYPYEEVSLSSITMNDVVLFADADIPFWIAHSMTEKTITFTPCAIWKRIGQHEVYGIRANHIANIYQYAKRPMRRSMDICDKYWIEHPERETMRKIICVESNANNDPLFTIRKTKILRNGQQLPIKVRKFIGTEEQMTLIDEIGQETSHRVYDVIMYRKERTLYAVNWRNQWESIDDEDSQTVGNWADQYA